MTESGLPPSTSPARWSLTQAVLVVFAGFSLLFGLLFAMIRGPHISDTEYFFLVIGMAAFLTLASFGGYWLLRKCAGIDHRGHPS